MELVFHRPNASHDLSPLAMPNVSRVACAKLLGMHLRHDLNFSQYIESVVVICNQRLYLLAQLKKQGVGHQRSRRHPVNLVNHPIIQV